MRRRGRREPPSAIRYVSGMNPKISSAPAPSSTSVDEIARRAYALWEHEGRPEGEHERHWREAEKQLTNLPPASSGNPANPSLAAREKIVAAHKKHGANEAPSVAPQR